MGFKLTKELADKMVNSKVEFRSRDLKLMTDFLVKEAGEKNYKKIKKVMKRVGYPLSSEKVRKIHYSNIGIRILLCLAAKEVIGWDEEKFEEWGRSIPREGMVIKFFSSIFKLDQEFFFQKVPQIFKSHIKNVEFEPIEANFEDKYFIFRLNRLKSLPLEGEKVALALYKGFFAGWAEMVVGEKVSCRVKVEKESYKVFIEW